MPEKLPFLNRDNIHFVMIGAALVFGLASGFVGQLPPPGSATPPLFWWPNGYTAIWVVFCFLMVALILVTRNQVLDSMVPGLPIWISGIVAASVVCALVLASLCSVTVFNDRVESQDLTFHGLDHETYRYEDVTDVQYGCDVINDRGLLHSHVSYILNFPQEDFIDLGKGRNDGRDGGRWVGAVALVDSILSNRGVRKSDVAATGIRAHDISQCMDLLSKERTPEEFATIQRIFQTPVPEKKKKHAPNPA